MNALLIYPEFPDTFWSFKHALKFIRKKASSPPLGILTVAAMLPAGWSKRLVDLNVRSLTEQDLAWADIAFISGMTIQEDSAARVISRCKRRGIRTVAGGPLFTCDPDRFEEVDHFVLNEAELTLPPFLRDFESGRARRFYRTSEFADIRKSPRPLWELLSLRDYASMNIQYSRGCPHHCEFCNVTALFGHRPRIKTAEQIIAELDVLYERGWRKGIFFVDDNFIGNKKVLMNEFLPELIKWKEKRPGITFNTEVTINLADDERLMGLMVDAGFDMVFIGIETPNEASLRECNKVQNRKRSMVEDVKKIQRAGLQVQGGFIVGFDSDTPSVFQQQIDFIQKSGIVTAMVGLLQAPAGTELYARLEREGRLLDRFSGDAVDGTTNIVTTMNFDRLREGYKRILENIYSPEHYYRRLKTFLQEYSPPKIESRPSFQEVLAFFRSAFRMGIIGRERLHYWKLLLWTRLHRPKLFPLAVTLAIYGHHFRKVCDLHVL